MHNVFSTSDFSFILLIKDVKQWIANFTSNIITSIFAYLALNVLAVYVWNAFYVQYLLSRLWFLFVYYYYLHLNFIVIKRNDIFCYLLFSMSLSLSLVPLPLSLSVLKTLAPSSLSNRMPHGTLASDYIHSIYIFSSIASSHLKYHILEYTSIYQRMRSFISWISLQIPIILSVVRCRNALSLHCITLHIVH